MAHKKNNTTVVIEYIRELIAANGLKAGDMLPSEGDIASALEVSRSCVREANHAMESIGLIEIRHGVGLFLREFNLDAIAGIFDYGSTLNPGIVLDLYDLRRQLESSLMPRVIREIDDEHLQRCDEILASWSTLAENGQSVHKVDGMFHEMLYSVIDNRTMASLCRIFWNTFYNLENRHLLKSDATISKERAFKTLEDHRMILHAIREKDAALATRLMYEHFSPIGQNPGNT